jgi:hypothetical protein
VPRHTDKTLVQFLIVLGVMIFWGILDWLKKRVRAQDPGKTGTTTETSQPPAPRPARKTDWEEELRRVLGDVQSSPPSLPPVIVYHEPRATPPLPAPTPVARLPLPRAVTMRVETKEPVAVPVPGFAQSIEAYQRASQLDVKMAEHLSQIAEQVRTHAVAQKEKASVAEIVQGISFVRNPQSIRSALVASVILGPPRGLDA